MAAAPQPAGEAAPAGRAASVPPRVTFAILAVLSVGFLAELIFAIELPSAFLRPSIKTLLALGCLQRAVMVEHGESYRLMTAPLLHADFLHLTFNAIALLMGGYLLERLVGRAWFLAIYVVSGVTGGLVSLAVHDPMSTSVGASGAIMGLFAAALTVSLRPGLDPAAAGRLRAGAVRILIPSLLPLAANAGGGTIDYGAHVGGALGGAALGLLVARTWPRAQARPRLRAAAATIGALGGALCLAGAVAVGVRYPRYEVLGRLIPQDELRTTNREARARVAQLVTAYPEDPRAHMSRGFVLAEAGDLAAAEAEFRTALRLADELRYFLGAPFDNMIRALLAETVRERGDVAEARAIARPACQTPPDQQPPESFRPLLRQLCD